MSKGIREAPTKALMKDIAIHSGDSPDAIFSLRQGLATAGALIGSIAASTFFILSGKSYVATFAAAAIPAALALLWIVTSFTGKSDIQSNESQHKSNESSKIKLETSKSSQTQQVSFMKKAKALIQSFQPVYWQALIVVSILFIARFDFSFVSLRAKLVMERSYLPALVTSTMLSTTFCSLMTGSMVKGAGVVRRNLILGIGIGVLVMANAVFAIPAFGKRDDGCKRSLWLVAVLVVRRNTG
eukprot:TRINITY_DN9741_c0_g2_i1.p2 TRINITY_DN9741_c0_g2~~TRINITY_DN9741_c0_g2_i1.p2  ORF type:complete len:264 (+),score=26.29 TRINITY_DN9741_c0_g2_i1:69-794(+)